MGAEVAAEVPLMSAGLDSLGAVELRNGISARFRISLPATFSFDYPTLQVTYLYLPQVETIHSSPNSRCVPPDHAAKNLCINMRWYAPRCSQVPRDAVRTYTNAGRVSVL